jgi:hypothetical protein
MKKSSTRISKGPHGNLLVTSRRGVVYSRSNYDGTWWREYKWDRPRLCIGSIFHLPQEIKNVLKQAIKNLFEIQG